ncbi:hypothetical protein A9179_06100 [Pseudomonas alcaligenes]|uniref:OmpR/PhoB-type domain-containing protein n=1 Tax=Aquipseudomonas alcaligenes TaxID=43263 RepID=A0ABR7RYG4_AQUAC|nr:winged helix-turn-helix domain-containing protein [Pseudomonas alcaligenes]MBC9249844.1 hypothetical protein [Pseudomonas alcaligenes]
MPRLATHEPSPALVIKTGRADDCHALFDPALYQLVLQRENHAEKVDLGYSGSRLLERLLRFPGEVVPRDELLAHAWSDRVVGQGSLNQQIYTLRQLLGDEKKREIIQTLPRRGYMLNPKFLVSQVPAEPAGAANFSPEAAATAVVASLQLPAAPRHGQRLLLLALALGALALITAGYIYYSLFQTEVQVEEHEIGSQHFVYANPSRVGVQALQVETAELAQRLAALSTQPTRFRLGKMSGFYEMLCERADGRTRWMMIHESQLSTLSDSQLRSCVQ